MKLLGIFAAALALSACTPIANTSQPILARTALTDTVIGGANYPIIISGSEAVGLSPDIIAQNLSFPPGLGTGSSFRAVPPTTPGLVNHGRLDIAPSGGNATSTLTFLHGQKRIGVGIFTMTRESYASRQMLGSTSSTLIGDLLLEAQQHSLDDERMLNPLLFH